MRWLARAPLQQYAIDTYDVQCTPYNSAISLRVRPANMEVCTSKMRADALLHRQSLLVCTTCNTKEEQWQPLVHLTFLFPALAVKPWKGYVRVGYLLHSHGHTHNRFLSRSSQSTVCLSWGSISTPSRQRQSFALVECVKLAEPRPLSRAAQGVLLSHDPPDFLSLPGTGTPVSPAPSGDPWLW